MSYSTGAEIQKLKLKDARSINALRNQILTNTSLIKALQTSITQMGKDLVSLQKLVNHLEILVSESITGGKEYE